MLVLLLGLAVLLGTGPGLRLLVALLLPRYDDAIAGSVAIERVEGRLLGRFTLRGVVLADRAGRSLVVADAIAVAWSPLALLRGELRVDALRLDGARVHLHGDERGGFGDLAPPGEDVPEDMSEPPGPDLPLTLDVGLHLRDAAVHAADGAPLVEAAELDARVLAAGRAALVDVTHATARLLGTHPLHGLRLRARWSAPVAVIDALRVRLAAAELELSAARLDLRRLAGAVRLRAEAGLAGLAAFVPADTLRLLRPLGSRVRLELAAEGAPEDMSVAAQLTLAPGAALTLAASGAWRDTPRIDDLRLDADIDLAPWTAGRLGRVRPTLELRARPLAGARLALVGGLRCRDCAGLGDPELAFSGALDRAREDLSLETSLSLAGVSALADVRVAGGALHALTWRLSAPDLARPARVARRFVPTLPALAGSLAARGRCVGAALRCRAALDLRRLVADDLALAAARLDLHVSEDMSSGSLTVTAQGLRHGARAVDHAELALAVTREPPGPVAAFIPGDLPPLRADLRAALASPAGDRARVDLSLTTGLELRADLRALELVRAPRARTAPPLRLALTDPAAITVRPRSVEVDALRLDLGRGRLALRGVADLDGASDLRLDVDDLALAALAPLAPDLRPRGRASARVRLRGRPDRPLLRADLAVADAGLRGRRLGDLDLTAHLADHRATLDLALRGPLARRLDVRADLPLRVDLSTPTWSFRQEFGRARLEVADLRLARLARVFTDTPARGRVDGTLALEGDFAAGPRLAGDVRARRVAVDGVPVGDVDLTVRHRDAWLRGQVELRRAGGRARLDAHVPLALDLPRGRVTWHRARDHHATLALDDIDLAAQLASVDEDLDLAGRLAARATLSGPASAPTIATELHADDLRHGPQALGSYELVTVTRAGGTSLELAGGGPVGRVHLQALTPLGVDAQGPTWRPEGWYALDLDLREFELSAVQALADVAVDGRVSGHLTLDGPGPRPRAHASIRADSLAYAGEPVGDLRLDLDLREGTAKLAARGRVGRRGALRLDACAPLDLDLGAGRLAWAGARTGELQLSVIGVDRSALAPVHTLPPDARLEVDVRAHANLDPTHVRGRLAVDGRIGRTDLGDTPIALRLDVDDARQHLRAALGERAGDNRLTVVVDTEAPLPALRRGEGDLAATPVRGAIRASGADLRPLSALLPPAVHDLEGRLFADLDLAGRLDRPLARGRVHLRDGAITVVPLQQRFQGVAADLAVDGSLVRLDQLVARSGEGRVRVTGTATLSAHGVDARADLRLRRFPVVRPGWPQVTVDTRVQAQVDTRPDALAIALTIPGAEVWVSDLTTRAPDPIPENDAVAVRGGPSPTPESPAADEAPPPGDEDVSKDMSLSIALTQPVHIQGPTMDMRWTGKITTREAGEDTEMTGQFTADRGRFELLGTEFRIEHGRVFLPEGGEATDPFLDLVAEASMPKAQVTVTLRGRLSRPALRLSSRPPLSEPQIFALLLTGSVDSNETDPRRAQASAAGLLVNFTNPTLARFADQRLGIDRIKFGFGADLTQPVLTVGKYLGKKIYAETTYHHNAPPRYNRIEAQVEYRFAPEWSVETFFGDAAIGGLDVFWRRRFGQAKKPRLFVPAGSLIGNVP